MSESNVRAYARRRGYRVCKSRQRSLHMDNHGEYMLIEGSRNYIVLGEKFDASLDDILAYLRNQEGEQAYTH